MSTVLHLARRGVEASSHLSQHYQTLDGEYKMPSWAIVLFVVTAVVYVIASTAVEYTFGRMIPTLIMIESPQATLFQPVKSDDPDATLDSKVEPELLLVKQEPITSSFRRTIKHLRTHDGKFGARFRGFRMFVVHNLLVDWSSKFIAVLPFVPRGTAPCFAAVLFANLSLAWTHIVISENNGKSWFRRIPPLKMWKKVAGPTVLYAIAKQLAIIVPVTLVMDMDGAEARIVAAKGLGIWLVCLAMVVFLVIPANVALIRVQASILPEDQETVVPFDRSFGGKVVAEILGGSGVIGFLDAWKTFERSSRVRLIKAYLKVFAIQLALMMFFFLVVIVQAIAIFGPTAVKVIEEISKERN
ncbi:hypothetical protein B0O99DRAFT_651058 [Bisporella sp. PMI_857]|nr:hypothetical protein B0O99DRAFT_651058 [Bisporella sp. PMI_857]